MQIRLHGTFKERKAKMKYQIRIKDTISDRPASGLFDTYKEAEKKLAEIREEIRSTWATPDTNSAYIFTIK